MYADDTTLFSSVQSLAANGENTNIHFENEMNMELGNIGNLITANKLSFTHSSGVLLGLPTLLHFFLSLGMVIASL